jgi:hypothetical protein
MQGVGLSGGGGELLKGRPSCPASHAMHASPVPMHDRLHGAAGRTRSIRRMVLAWQIRRACMARTKLCVWLVSGEQTHQVKAQRLEAREDGARWPMGRADQQHAPQARHRPKRERVHEKASAGGGVQRWQKLGNLLHAASLRVHCVARGRAAQAQRAPVVGAQAGPQCEEHGRVLERV